MMLDTCKDSGDPARRLSWGCLQSYLLLGAKPPGEGLTHSLPCPPEGQLSHSCPCWLQHPGDTAARMVWFPYF